MLELEVRFMVFNATFNNVTDISVLLDEETGILPGENHRPAPRN
jgi:hypothetical protein